RQNIITVIKYRKYNLISKPICHYKKHSKMNILSKFLVTAAVGFMAYQPLHVEAQQDKDKWIDLFDGKTLTGWKTLGGEAPYNVENGMIVGTMTKGTPNSFLVTEQEYGDFILEVDVKLEGDRTNSGIQTRSQYDPHAN